MFRLGIPELVVLFVFMCVIYISWRLVAKTGHSGALSVLLLIPLVNLGLMVYLSFSEWPIEKELRILREQANRGV